MAALLSPSTLPGERRERLKARVFENMTSCVVLYLHAAHEYNLISAPLTGYGMETKRRKQFLARNVLVND